MKNGYYWLTSERSSTPSVAQHIDGKWYLINDDEPVPIEAITRRGWQVGKRIKHQDRIQRLVR